MTIEEMVQEFKRLPTGFLTDGMNLCKLGGWTDGVFPVSRTARHFAGRAVTMKYGPIRGSGPKMPRSYEVIFESNPGDVLVLAAMATSCWVIGENICHVAENRDLAAVVVDGCIRDLDECGELRMPVFCRGGGVRPYRTHLELEAINVPVEFAGAQIRPGDILVGDGDGIVVIPPERAEEVLFQAKFIAEKEAQQEEIIKRGASLEEILALSNSKKAPLKKAD